MKRILFIVPYPTESAPSQRFRFEQYFDILEKQGFQIEIAPFWSSSAWLLLYEQNQTIIKIFALVAGIVKRFMLLFKIHGYSMVFIHREALPLGPPIIEYIIARVLKKKIIYDFDDAIWLPNTSEQNSIAARLKFHHKVNYICKWSWKVSCGNVFLADYARKYNQQVFINPTTIDTDYHLPGSNKTSDELITIGWTGTHSTTKYLKLLVPIFLELKKKHAIKVMVISDQPPDWDYPDYEFIEWNKEKEIEQLRRFDIGIMPLYDTIWEQGKCGFKALQYMAIGIPTIVSNVGVNIRIIKHGENGFLCDSQQDWSDYLSKLICSKTERKTMGAAGRKTVIESYSVLANTELFLSLFA